VRRPPTTFAMALILAGCATSKEVPLPDGSQGYVLNHCVDMAACYRKAATMCAGGKYDVVSHATNPVANAQIATTEVTMTIRCAIGSP
jgi:hypothetical protein